MIDENEIVRQRLAGNSYVMIADAFYISQDEVRKIIAKKLDCTLEELELREEQERLNYITARLWPKLTEGHARTAEVYKSISDAKAELASKVDSFRRHRNLTDTTIRIGDLVSVESSFYDLPVGTVVKVTDIVSSTSGLLIYAVSGTRNYVFNTNRDVLRSIEDVTEKRVRTVQVVVESDDVDVVSDSERIEHGQNERQSRV